MPVDRDSDFNATARPGDGHRDGVPSYSAQLRIRSDMVQITETQRTRLSYVSDNISGPNSLDSDSDSDSECRTVIGFSKGPVAQSRRRKAKHEIGFKQTIFQSTEKQYFRVRCLQWPWQLIA